MLRRAFRIISRNLQHERLVLAQRIPDLIVRPVASLEYYGPTGTLEAHVQIPPRAYPAVVEEEVLSPIVPVAFRYLDTGSPVATARLAFHAPEFLARATLPPISILPVQTNVEIR